MTDGVSSIDRDSGAPIRIVATAGKPSITPASRLCLTTLDHHPHLLRGSGIDWGSGSGLLAVAAATQPGVDFVLGLELDPAEVRTSRLNAELNGVADRTGFLVSDSYDPLPGQDASILQGLCGSTSFLIANPPTSAGDDGLEWRRRVLAGALRFLEPQADVLLQVSRQYGEGRTERLADDVGGYEYKGLLEATDWVAFDQDRSDLREALDWYVAEEARSGEPYSFFHPTEDHEVDATEARRLRETTGASPRSQWRMYRFTRLI
jgi:methylase of polypeptide subunit release factors